MILNTAFPYTPSPWWTPWEVVLIPLLPLARRDGHFRTKVFQIKWLYWPLTRARRQWLFMMMTRRQQQQQPNDDPIVLYVNVSTGQTQRLPASQLPPALNHGLRYVAVADTHLLHHDIGKLPAGDVLVHAGDVLVQGNRHHSNHFAALWQDFGSWLRVQQEQGGFQYALVTGGNHDGPLQEEVSGQVSLFGSDTTLFVPNGLVEVKKVSSSLATTTTTTTTQQQIYLNAASRGNPNAANAAFQYTTDTAARQVWSQVPADADAVVQVLVTHGPPAGILDGHGVGCRVLRRHVLERIQPVVHVFGHVHASGPGVAQRTVPVANSGSNDNSSTTTITFINAAMVDFDYALTHAPVVFDVP